MIKNSLFHLCIIQLVWILIICVLKIVGSFVKMFEWILIRLITHFSQTWKYPNDVSLVTLWNNWDWKLWFIMSLQHFSVIFTNNNNWIYIVSHIITFDVLSIHDFITIVTDHQDVYSFYDHTQQNWMYVNSFINTRHLKDNVYQKSLSYLYVNVNY